MEVSNLPNLDYFLIHLNSDFEFIQHSLRSFAACFEHVRVESEEIPFKQRNRVIPYSSFIIYSCGFFCSREEVRRKSPAGRRFLFPNIEKGGIMGPLWAGGGNWRSIGTFAPNDAPIRNLAAFLVSERDTLPSSRG
jgi:hypothetical protein